MENLKTTKWDNSKIYKNFQDEKIEKDLQTIQKSAEKIASHEKTLIDLVNEIEQKNETNLMKNTSLIADLIREYLDAGILIGNLGTYSHTASSVNAFDYDAKNLMEKIINVDLKVSKAYKPIQIILNKSSDEFVKQLLSNPKVNEITYAQMKERENSDFLLSVHEEKLITGFSTNGLGAWGKLYTELSSSLKTTIRGETIGVSSAVKYLSDSDRNFREEAYRAINKSWETQEIAVAAILNAINGWRNENYEVRSTKKPMHYLDSTCHSARITRTTLDSMMSATFENKKLAHDMLATMADELKVPKLAPWDMFANYPHQENGDLIPFDEAINLIKDAFSSVSTELSDFVDIMYKNNWIDSSPSENRGPGAYCTGFSVSREPRVFITYQGSIKNVITLAHELGHAYHNWVMKDIPFYECRYPMTLAETASIFAETVVRDYLVKNAKNKHEIKGILWQELQSAQGLMLNISSRFEFEKRFVEKRKARSLTVPEMKSLMVDSFNHWYGDSLSEHDEMFWASKMHFSMAGRSFYNYPYLFGYLFSLGIYAEKDNHGSNFHKAYVDLLRDTGRMNSEELAMKHLGADLTRPEFWNKSIKIISDLYTDYKNIK